MNTNIYELKKASHAEEIIHYLKHLVVPKSITRKTQPGMNINAQENSRVLNDTGYDFNQIVNGKMEDVVSVQLFI